LRETRVRWRRTVAPWSWPASSRRIHSVYSALSFGSLPVNSRLDHPSTTPIVRWLAPSSTNDSPASPISRAWPRPASGTHLSGAHCSYCL